MSSGDLRVMRIRNRMRAAAAGILMAACVGGVSGAAGLVPDGIPADVALVFTGDTIGYIEPCG